MASYIFIYAIVLLASLLIGLTAFSSNDIFAKDYKKTLAVSQANYCGQGDVGMNVQCTNTVSQTQGNENGVAVND